jgi:tetrapyrrole methylase family protein / MazG family protein
MTTTAITILGLGPGRIDDLTLRAYDVLQKAAAAGQTIYCRTLIHPTVPLLKERIPDLQMQSYDRLYEEATDWSTLYQQIAEDVCTLAAQQAVIYAVPGHPLVAETSVEIVLQMARERGLNTSIIEGVSFVEVVCSALKIDPFDSGLQLVDATRVASLSIDEIAGKIVPTIPLLVAQVYNRRIASAVKLALAECYPDEWPIKLVRAIDGEEKAIIEMPLYELDRGSYADHLSTLYVPPVDGLGALRLPETLRYIIMRLRREPDGCPWDRQQTHQSLTRHVLEEAYEVVEALDENDMEHLTEELGDLLLQVYLHAEIARQEGDFSIGDVFEQISAKLLRRHPHVFGDTEVSNAGQVVQNWEEIKRQERIKAGKDVQNEGAIRDVPSASPSLVMAQEYQKRAARTGFEFRKIEDVYAKLAEEVQELQRAETKEEQKDEMGDVLFIAAKIARWHNIDAEEALRQANRKFRRRFQAMETLAREQKRELPSFNDQEWRELWRQAKAATAS